MKLFRLILPTIIVFLILSCHSESSQKRMTAEEFKSLCEEFNLPEEKTYLLDKNFIKYLFSLDSIKYKEEIKNHYQPIQATYYNKTGKLVSFHINCYAGIGIDDNEVLNWNQQNAFDNFIPRSAAPVDSILPLPKHLSFVRTFDNNPIDTTGYSSFDYTIIIHWGRKWRPVDSQNLISIVKENLKLVKNKSINILYVNNDKIW